MKRLDNIDYKNDPALMKEKSELLAAALIFIDEFYQKIEHFGAGPSATPLAALSILQNRIAAPSFQAGIHTDFGLSPLSQAVATSGLSGDKSIPLHKWDLRKFSGNTKAMSVHSFFKKVEELRVARSVSKNALLDAGIDLLTDRAY